jgi:hypothetical protein
MCLSAEIDFLTQITNNYDNETQYHFSMNGIAF